MSTNVAVDDSLLREAKKLGKHRSEKATINEALKWYIQRKRELVDFLEVAGTVDFDPEFLKEMDRKKK
jgi:predicted CopG family antitoxin